MPATIRFKARDHRRDLPAYRIAQLGVARTFQLVRVLGSHDRVARTSWPAWRSATPPLMGRERRGTRRARCSRVSALATRRTLPATQLTYIDQKRLELARALALEPDLLLLDEWLAGLNPSELQRRHRADQDRCATRASTIILVEHVMDAIRSLCDRCVVMNAGAQDRRRPAGRRAGRHGGGPRLSGRRRCLRSRNLSAVYGKHRALDDVDARQSAAARSSSSSAPTAPARSTLLKAIARSWWRMPGARISLDGREISAACRRTTSSKPALRWCRRAAASSAS